MKRESIMLPENNLKETLHHTESLNVGCQNWLKQNPCDTEGHESYEIDF